MIEFIGEKLDRKTMRLLKKIAYYALKKTDQNPHKLEVAIEFVYDEEIRELNKQTRNIDAVTDVLSFPNLDQVYGKTINKNTFPNDVNPENGKVDIGDVVINLDRAREQADSFGHSVNREIAYLMVHGILHLLGFDHEDPLDEKLMRGQEEEILAKFKLKRV